MYEEIKQNIDELRLLNPKKALKYEEELLIMEARRRYPIGTVFSNKNLGKNCDNIKVTGINFEKDSESLFITADSNDSIYGKFTVYKDGKWAEITTAVVSSLSTTIAVKHWGPDLIGKQFVSEVDNLNGSHCVKEVVYTIVRIEGDKLSFKLNDHSNYYISKPSFLKHCKLVPASGISIPTIQETKSTVNYTVSTALTELSVNIPHGRKTKQVPVITIELSQINCNL